MFKCIECGLEKELKYFYKKPLLKIGHDRKCKRCRNLKTDDWEAKPENRLKRREYYYQRQYKMSLEDRKKFKELHGYKCNICGITEEQHKRSLFIDHDHITGKVRGLLCDNHNKGLGVFKDSIDHLLKAVEYLKEVK